MKINVVLPYTESGKYYERWAVEEDSIDFGSEKEKADRCTVSFAALELVTYFEKLGHEVCVSDEKSDCVNISLKCISDNGEDFDIVRTGDDVEITGYGRRGTLYGSYELLEAQGVRWYSPDFEYVPVSSEFTYPESRRYKYEMPEGRGFHFEDLQNESKSFLHWMARNRMNMHACHSHCKAFQQKLGMIFETGGHIFEKIINPLNITEDGRYFIDAHRDWYGKRDGEITVDNATKTQFCVSNEELLDYLSGFLIKKLNKEWINEDVFEIDGFDTWGKRCNCDKCRALGNGSDTTLKFISHFRNRINEATGRGELRPGIKLSFCVYEGTNTMAPPENPIPQNLLDAGDYAFFCPILRCYEHDFSYPCDRNAKYIESLDGWVKTGIKVRFNEYYNVSKYEDLPLLLTKRIDNDIKYYIDHGVTGMVYMHIFIKDWGVRTLNHYLYANVTRDRNCDAQKLINEYYKNAYGKYADEAAVIYEKIEKATGLIASWRAWFEGSVLTALMEWNGTRQEELLDCDFHIKGKVVECGKNTVKLLSEALDSLRAIRENELKVIKPEMFSVIKNVVNPVEMLKKRNSAKFFDKLNDDIRGMKYGLDVFRLMTLFADLYDSLRENRSDSADILAEIKELGQQMSEYTFSVSFNSYQPDFEVRDALKRSQLKDLYYRCLALQNQ